MSISTGRGVLGFATAPFVTQRMHPSNQTGDSILAIRRCAKVAPGPDKVRALDFNLQAVHLPAEGRYAIIGAHWATVGGNGYTHWVDDAGHPHPFTKAELRTHEGLTMGAFVARHAGTQGTLLRLRRGGTGERPITWEEAVKEADRLDVLLNPELKSTEFSLLGLAPSLVGVCRKYDYPCHTMALPSMPNAGGKCWAIRKTGGHFMLIFGPGLKGLARRAAYGRRITAAWPLKPDLYG